MKHAMAPSLLTQSDLHLDPLAGGSAPAGAAIATSAPTMTAEAAARSGLMIVSRAVPTRRRIRAPFESVTRAVLALLLCLGMSSLTSADTAQPLTTILIVARADLPDPNFRDATVLVMNNLGPAPVGIVINRPTRVRVAELFPDLSALARLDDRVYFGGPVDLGSVSFLFRAATPPDRAVRVLDGVYMSGDRELLRNLLTRDKPMEGLRIFVGYSGWAPGQLEAEIARGEWKLAPAEPGAVFEHNAESPWPGTPAPGEGRRI
jgi:putative transcriptional regulator